MSIAFLQASRRLLVPSLMCMALVACSGPVVPPLGVDDDTTVSSIPPSEPIDTVQQDRQYLDTPNLAGDTSGQQTVRRTQSTPDSQQANLEGVNIDDQLGVAPSLSLAEEQSRDIVEGNTSQPVVDGIGTDSLTERTAPAARQTQAVTFEDATTASQITLPTRRRNVEQETEVALLPRANNPAIENDAPVFGQLSAAERACRNDLQKMGVRFEEMAPISKGNSCGIANPMKVSGFQGGVQLKPAATLNCQMTRYFAKWVKNELVPSARMRYFSGIQSIRQMSSYSCRKMNSSSNNPWSEHARGNALDIGGFTLKNGKHIDIRRKSFFAFREKGLLKTVREDSCKYFTTVLGPGDAYHGDHFHFDLRKRRSGYRHCSL
jgi:hypothetical protein